MAPLAVVFGFSRVSGAVMAQLIAYEPWGLAVDPVPGAVFHAVVAGSCWLRIPGRAPQHLMPGDVVLLPTNTPHELVSSADDRTDSLARFETDTPRTPDSDMVIQGPGAGPEALCRGFARLVGGAPPEYLARWRMDLAARRLRDTDGTVAAIAAAVGYRSEYSFSRAFTRHRGLAPGRYRRHARARALAAA